jgi:hypothetical protein
MESEWHYTSRHLWTDYPPNDAVFDRSDANWPKYKGAEEEFRIFDYKSKDRRVHRSDP